MTTVQPFDFRGTAVRVLTGPDGDPWFVAADVCAVLDIANSRDALSRLDADEKGVGTADTPGGPQQVATVSEPGLYGLVWTSRKPEAADFRRWIKHEVLPAIRRTGSYSVPAQRPAELSRADLARMVLAAEEELTAARAQVAELEPDARMARTCMSADGDWSVREAAHVLSRDPAISTGQRRLFGTLRELGWVDRRGIPYQRHIEAGRVSSRVRVYDHPHTGEPVMADPQVRITGKGLAELHRHLGGTAELVTEQLEVTR